MKRAKTKRRMLASILAAAMLLGMLPAVAANTGQEYIIPLEQAEYSLDELWRTSSLPDSAGNNKNGSIYTTEAGAWVR